jgi:hypothetical protein
MTKMHLLPQIPVAVPFKTWVFGRSLAGIAGSNPAAVWMPVSLSVLLCQVGFSTSGCSLVQRNPT